MQFTKLPYLLTYVVPCASALNPLLPLDAALLPPRVLVPLL